MNRSALIQIWLCIFFLCASLSVYAQLADRVGKLKGKLTDIAGKPIAYASISLVQSNDSTTIVKGTLTEENGEYLMDKIPYGSYLLSVSMSGYEGLLRGPFVVDSLKREQTVDNIQMTPLSSQMAGVTVTSKKPPVEFRTDKTILNIENSPLAAGNTAFDILRRAPGVIIDQDGAIGLRGKQRVTVLIDGKATYVSGGELAKLLSSIDGNAIQSIELISNPSAKYEAEGNAGIINIRLKKNRNYGLNGNILSGGGYGRYYKINEGLTLNYRQKHFNLFGNYNFSQNKSFGNVDIIRENNADNIKTFFNLVNRIKSNTGIHNYKAGVDYYINEKNTLGAVITGFYNNNKVTATNTTLIGSKPNQTDSSIVAHFDGRSKFNNIAYNLNYQGIFDTLGQELTASFDYSTYNNKEKGTYTNQFYNSSGQISKSPYIFRTPAETDVNIWAGKVDYTYPFNSNLKLNTGLKSSFVKTDNIYHFDELINDIWTDNPSISNFFSYKENINAGYISLNRDFKTTKIQAGIRGEQTNSKGNLITGNKIVNRHYFSLFPNLSVNHDLSSNSSLGFSYNRRIDRPNYKALNPFLSYVDLYTFQLGNAFLKPQFTNSFDLSFTYKKSLNFSFNYSHTKDVISQALYTDTIKKTLFVTDQNLDNLNAYTLTISTPLAIAKWWNTYNSLVTYYNEYSSPEFMGLPFRSGKTSFLFNSSQTFTINPTTSAELSGYYQSAMVYGTYKIQPFAGIDAGINKSFSNNKFNLKLAVNDPFNINKIRVVSAVPGQNYKLNQKQETRVLRLTLTFRFGSNEIKDPRENSKSSTEEESRVKTGN